MLAFFDDKDDDRDFRRQPVTAFNEDTKMTDDDFDPIARADTGIPREHTHGEIEAMLDRDAAYHKFLDHQKDIFILLHKVLDELEREDHEEGGETTSILREKILRGRDLSDTELDSAVFVESCRLLFGKISTKEFLQRMTIISRLVDLESE